MVQELDPMKFEDLSSAYRIEMRSQLLGDVRKDLYPALIRLQESIQRDYETEYSKDPDSIMCEGKNERRKSASVLVQKVIDLRMEKIIMMALRASMGANNTLDKLTPEEREYYNNVVEGSKKHRNIVLKDKVRKNYVIPDISSGNAAVEEGTVPAADPPQVVSELNVVTAEHEGEEFIEHPRKVVEGPGDELVVIRMLEDLPEIAGPDRDYDLRKEDVVRLPATLANVLIKHEKAVLLNITP